MKSFLFRRREKSKSLGNKDIIAQKTVKLVLETWKEGNMEKLYHLTQKSWRTKHTFNNFDIFKIEDYSIDKIEFETDVMFDAFVELKIPDQPVTNKYLIKFVAERKPYITDPKADFGFNPITMRIL